MRDLFMSKKQGKNFFFGFINLPPYLVVERMNKCTTCLRVAVHADAFCYYLTLYCSGCVHPMTMITKAKLLEMNYCFDKINNTWKKTKVRRVHVKGLSVNIK